MLVLWPWTLLAVIVPMFGGSVLACGPVRPDIPLAFVSVAAQRRFGLAALAPPCIVLCAARYVFAPPDAGAEAVVFAGTACALIVLHRLALLDSIVELLATTAAGFAAVVLGTALLQRGTGDAVTLPSLLVLAGTLVYTLAIAVAFALLLPERRGRS